MRSSNHIIRSQSEAYEASVKKGIFTGAEIDDQNKKDRTVTAEMLNNMNLDISNAMKENKVESFPDFFTTAVKTLTSKKKYSKYFGLDEPILVSKIMTMMMYQAFGEKMKEESGMIAPTISIPFAKAIDGEEDCSIEIRMSVKKGSNALILKKLADDTLRNIGEKIGGILEFYGFSHAGHQEVNPEAERELVVDLPSDGGAKA